jgi:hypothetical protein
LTAFAVAQTKTAESAIRERLGCARSLAILMKPIADLILENGRITTLDPRHPEANEVVIVGDQFAGVDNAAEPH